MSLRPVAHQRAAVPTMEGAGVKLYRAFGFEDPSPRFVQQALEFPSELGFVPDLGNGVTATKTRLFDLG